MLPSSVAVHLKSMRPTRSRLREADSAALENRRFGVQGRANFHTMSRPAVNRPSSAYDIATPGFIPAMYMDSNSSHLDFFNMQSQDLWFYPQASSLMEVDSNQNMQSSFSQAPGKDLTEFPQHSWGIWPACPTIDYGGSHDFHNACHPPVNYSGEIPDGHPVQWNNTMHNLPDTASPSDWHSAPSFYSAAQFLPSTSLHNEDMLHSFAVASNTSDLPHEHQTMEMFRRGQIPCTQEAQLHWADNGQTVGNAHQRTIMDMTRLAQSPTLEVGTGKEAVTQGARTTTIESFKGPSLYVRPWPIVSWEMCSLERCVMVEVLKNLFRTLLR